MKNIIKTIVILIGVLLIINALWLTVVSNMNTGIVGTLIFGIILIILAIIWNKVEQLTKSGFGKIIKNVVISAFILWLILLSFLTIYGKIDTVTYKEDAVIVLGCGVKGQTVSNSLAYRLDKMVEYYNKNSDVIIIVSGGKGPQEENSEAKAMEKYLIDRGIPASKIIKEENSTSTTENIKHSKEILDKTFNREYQVAIITNNFHIYRSNEIAKKAGLNANHYNAKVNVETIVPNYIRETIGVVKYWILGK